MRTKESLVAMILAAGAVLLIALCRLLPHPWNFAPVCAAALFGGIYLDKKLAFSLPLISMFIADLVLGISWADLPFVYGALTLSVFIGGWIKSDQKQTSKFVVKLFSGTIASSVIFFVITNFGAWIVLDIYTKDVGGLISAYVMGIPFFKNTVLSDLFFITVFVGAYEVIYRLAASRLKTAPVAE